MKKLLFMGILIVSGLLMISTALTTTPIIAQSSTDNTNMTDTDNTNMTDTDNTNMTDTDNTNMTESGQISKRK
jgi:hypothetical protein